VERDDLYLRISHVTSHVTFPGNVRKVIGNYKTMGKGSLGCYLVKFTIINSKYCKIYTTLIKALRAMISGCDT